MTLDLTSSKQLVYARTGIPAPKVTIALARLEIAPPDLSGVFRPHTLI